MPRPVILPPAPSPQLVWYRHNAFFDATAVSLAITATLDALVGTYPAAARTIPLVIRQAALASTYGAAARTIPVLIATALLRMAVDVLARPIPLALPLAQKIVSLVADATPVTITLSLPAAAAQYLLIGGVGGGFMRIMRVAPDSLVARARTATLALLVPVASTTFTRRYDSYDLAVQAGELDEDWG